MADLFNSDSDSDIEPASAEARGAVLDQLRRQADETFARGPVVGPPAIELHWRRVGRAFAEVTLSLASAGSYTLRWSVPGVATPPQTATGRWRRDGSALTLAPCVDELSAYEWLDDGKLVVTVDGEAHVSLPPRHVVKGP